MEEEEEMWFNEDEDLEELETYNSVMKCKLFVLNCVELKTKRYFHLSLNNSCY